MVYMDVQILKRILVNQIQEYIKRIMPCDQMEFILSPRVIYYLHINQCDTQYEQN